MATKKEIDRAVRAADRRIAAKEKAAAKFARGLSSTKTAKSIGLDPDDCCTPSMAGAVLGRLSRKGGRRKSGTTEKPGRSKPPTQSKSESKRSKPAAKPKGVSKTPRRAPAKPGSEGSVGRTKAAASNAPKENNISEPVRLDHLLDDIKKSAKDNYLPRKFVATALRKMLHARMRNGFSVKTPNHSMATTLDVRSRSGSFDDKHRAALYDLFGDSGGKSYPFMVLVSRFIGDSNSVPTGIRSDYADEFRRLVADAAGLPKPKPYAPKAESSQPKPTTINSGLTPRDLELLASLMIVELKAEGIKAKATRKQPRPDVLVETGDASVILRATVNGFEVARVRTDTQDGAKLLEVLESRVAPLFSRPDPVRTTYKLIYIGLPSSIRKKNVDNAAQRWAGKLMRVDYMPSGPAANEEPKRHLEAVSDTTRRDSKPGKALSIGRADHEERRDRRVDRLTSRAAKARGNRDRLWSESNQGLPPLGEPIKVGHHSEKRHRRAIERAQDKGFKGLEEDRKAKSLAARASAAARNTAISSDDPEALTRLKEKLAELEAERDEIKRKNRLARAGKLSDTENPENPPHLQGIAGKRVYPMRGYVLKNLGGNIKRVKERIETLSKREGREAREVSRGGVRVVENGDVSRVQIHHDEIPPKEHRVWLKQHGFRWARSEQAWQRQLGDTAWNTAMRYLDEMVEKRDDTPYSRVESSAPKSNYTDKDLAFWRSEYATLDKEFPGEFTKEMYEEVGHSFRARRAGDPWRQAALYAKYRRGELSLEEAVANLYAYGRRDARPKPRSKRKPATSTMSIDAFVEALKAAAADVRGVLTVKVQAFSGHRSTVALAHTAANTSVHGMDSRRLSIWVRGWGKDGEPPKDGRVKMEPQTRGYRGRTETPEKLVPAIVKLLERNVAENWRD